MVKYNFDPLTGLRGLCSLAIVVGHAFSFFMPVGLDARPPYLSYVTAVTLFFVISGFILTVREADSLLPQPAAGVASSAGASGPAGVAPAINSHLPPGKTQSPTEPLLASSGPTSTLAGDRLADTEDGRSGETLPSSRDFFARRAARVLPVYYFGVAANLPVFISSYSGNIGMLLLQLTGALLATQSVIFMGGFLNGPLWQVSAFLVCYAAFPGRLRWLHAKSDAQLSSTYAWLISVPLVVMVGGMVVGPNTFGVLHVFSLMRLPQFLCGVVLGLRAKRGTLPETPSSWFGTMALSLVYVGLLAASVGFGTYSGMLLLDQTVFQLLLVPVIVSWIYALTVEPSNVVHAVLESAPVMFLGKLSYSIYCLHWPVLETYSALVGGAPSGRVPLFDLPKRERIPGPFNLTSWHIVPVLAIVVALALVTHHVVENPCRRAIRKRWRGAPAPAAAPQA